MELSVEIPVLDHGYLKLVESWGSDERIIEAARMSTGKGFKGWGSRSIWTCPKCTATCDDKTARMIAERGVHQNANSDTVPNSGVVFCSSYLCRDETMIESVLPARDEKLLSYLYTHKHHTPFEMCGATFEVQAPIFVFREWMRHRTQSYNEMSARYTPLPNLSYEPLYSRISEGSTSNKQASSDNPFNSDSALRWLEHLHNFYRDVQDLYEEGLSAGIPKELARLCLPVARYSRMRASANLRNWLGFLALRMAPNAQYEIRTYANTLHDELVKLFPRTMELFDKRKENE